MIRYRNLRNLLFNIYVVMAFLLPHSNIIYLSIAGTMPVILRTLSYSKRVLSYQPGYIFIFIVVLSYALNIFIGQSDFGGEESLRLLSFLLIFITFPFVSNLKIYNIYLYLILIIIF